MIAASLHQPRLVQALIILLAVVSVAVADVFLKKAAAEGNLGAALTSPWLFGAVGLYLLQIALFIVLFIAGWRLSIIGALQTAVYALVVLAAGVLIYRETLTPLQTVGVFLAFAGVLLINWR